MDVSRNVYSRDLKIAAMRALDAGATNAEIARKYQVRPHLLERWRSEWRAKGDWAFPGLGGGVPGYRPLMTPAASPNWNGRSAS